ncbi:unnamed protein product [Parnassius apollo]|uniref:(apollo) hypothetical protein n=1 Tax=Parnassius apollo TaxID=110799 RepID=A0A8S3XST2_PARAO|nr:unnamed protein product [Parnassius apollo]
MKNTENVQTLSSELEITITNSLEQDKAFKTSNKKPKIITEQTQELIFTCTELLSKREKSKEMRHELKELYKKTNGAIGQDHERHRRIIIERNMEKYKSSKRALKELSTHGSNARGNEKQRRYSKARNSFLLRALQKNISR